MAKSPEPNDTITTRYHYSPPWADLSIIGVAGSSGSGKSSISDAIVRKLNLPWVVILSMDSFYKSLDAESSRKAFANEYDFDAPDAIDFDALVNLLRDLKAGKRAEIPVYSFVKHQRMEETTSIYSPHVLILEGIFALYDPRVLELLDMRVIIRDVRDRGRDVEGIIKQWLAFVKPNFVKASYPIIFYRRSPCQLTNCTFIQFVDPQRKVADIIVPRGVENKVAITMMVQYIEQKLLEKSKQHRAALSRLQLESLETPLSSKVIFIEQTPQLRGIDTILHDIDTSSEDFIFYFDRLSALLIELALNNVRFESTTITTPQGYTYNGLRRAQGDVSAIVLERGGAALEVGLKRVIPDCKTGHIVIESNVRTGEPELKYQKLPRDIQSHGSVLLLDCHMSSGGSALMAVQVLLDHGVAQDRIVLATYSAGRMGLHRLTTVFPDITVVACKLVQDIEERWIEKKYFRC
ncbi:hypothetical protein PpBr36_04624 [Pyricularia pennisetigena]|uniref:hypothetical protein n=1 Tax=Pyricularia pennisetigena TaxID=1578925 RepID=UPI001150F6E6|nr:hypothetical protein PpBr36_04624 [Pyricularia pennisetigena]TLS27630.1 hypothetical protein PpBr36_04624 [Pyricularia pennisetigena]